MELLINIAMIMAGLVLGFILQELYFRFSEEKAKNDARSILFEAHREADRVLREADQKSRDETLQRKENCEKEIYAKKEELSEWEAELEEKEQTLTLHSEELEKREETLCGLREKLLEEENLARKKQQRLEKLLEEETKMLREVAGLSREDAVVRLLQKLEVELEQEAAAIIEKHLRHCREESNRKSMEILLMAIQRCAVEHTADSVVSNVDIPNDEMKGRVIGRDGRNIRAFEKATGVNVIVDDTPGVIVVSGFDPLRREIARESMQRLVNDGRIHPARIEEVVENTSQEIHSIVMEVGRQAAYEANISNLKERQIELIGKMKFHLVGGQNLLQHTEEVVYLSAILAGELGLDITLAKRCALLHDIGRTADHFQEGSHAKVGADIAKRCHEELEVVNAIAAHHEEVPAQSLYAILLQIAHSVALKRPASRKEALARHLKRMEQLEDIVLSFEGVEQAYAIQSGREIRCVVKSEEIDDARAIKLAHEIAQKIERELSYPGEIKVSLERETRIIEYAR